MSSPWSSQSSYQSAESRALSNIGKAANDGTRDFQRNIRDLNQSVAFMSQYLTVMQKGIDDANKNILQKIQDFIQDLIIIFGGGDYGDSGFEWGDLGYIIQAIGALFGFQGLSGPINLLNAALHFLENFLQPLGLLGDIINGFIQAVFEFLAGLLSNVPIVGDTLSEIVMNVADGVNETHSTATTAQSTATTAQSTATSAAATATAAQSTATAAQTTASNAASVAAAAQQTADIAYDFSTYREKEFPVTSAALLFGNNETVLGILLAVPPGAIIKLTRLVYSMKSNTGTVTVDLIRRTLAGAESVIHTTNISSGAITFPDNTIDFQINDLDHFFCNVTAISGAVTALHCFVEYVILPAP